MLRLNSTGLTPAKQGLFHHIKSCSFGVEETARPLRACAALPGNLCYIYPSTHVRWHTDTFNSSSSGGTQCSLWLLKVPTHGIHLHKHIHIDKNKTKSFLKMCVFCLHVCKCTVCAWCPKRSEESTGPPGTIVSHHVNARNQTPIVSKNSKNS